VLHGLGMRFRSTHGAGRHRKPQSLEASPHRRFLGIYLPGRAAQANWRLEQLPGLPRPFVPDQVHPAEGVSVRDLGVPVVACTTSRRPFRGEPFPAAGTPAIGCARPEARAMRMSASKATLELQRRRPCPGRNGSIAAFQRRDRPHGIAVAEGQRAANRVCCAND